jgi:hypothetical protein
MPDLHPKRIREFFIANAPFGRFSGSGMKDLGHIAAGR